MKYLRTLLSVAVLLSLGISLRPISAQATSLTTDLLDRTQGRILLQIESHGEAWYVDPVSARRYYMPDGATAYQMMRAFGLGISEANYLKLINGDSTLLRTLKGRIILRVEAHGEAYYIHPDGEIYYLSNGAAAYSVMREHSLGITNRDLNLITSNDLASVASLTFTPDIQALNSLWLNLVNEERSERGADALVLDQRWNDSATTWADYLGENELFTHTRPAGQSLEDWVEEFDYSFAVLTTPTGWTSNLFGENLALMSLSPNQVSAEAALERAMGMFMSEESYGGGHFENVMNESWNSTGAGFYLVQEDGHYQMYMVFHFGNLEGVAE